MPKLDIAGHRVLVSTDVPYQRTRYVELEIRADDGDEVALTLDVAEAVALVRALEGAIDDALNYNYMSGSS